MLPFALVIVSPSSLIQNIPESSGPELHIGTLPPQLCHGSYGFTGSFHQTEELEDKVGN